MIFLSCEKFDSAHRVIVKRGLKTTQGRFYKEHIIERVSGFEYNQHDMKIAKSLISFTSQEMRRDMTRNHRLRAIATKIEVDSHRFQRVKRPNLTGTIRQCLEHEFTRFISNVEKQSLVNSVTRLVIDSLDIRDQSDESVTSSSSVAEMVQKQHIKVSKYEIVAHVLIGYGFATHFLWFDVVIQNMSCRSFTKTDHAVFILYREKQLYCELLWIGKQ